ncbi:MAG: GvpL/GvpF family gas vesicle protein [Bacteroidetes bacterium]|nr:GvpL/GvpF family gas vesicle protein [Bacteroidota bacterium]MCW5895272.1 GvpL/GvpF family gas vesicle protein [Bacteroidota bacterium]
MRLEQLIDRLAKHKRLQALLADTSHLPVDNLVDTLVREFEYVIDRYSSWSEFAGQVRRIESEKVKTPSLSYSVAERGSTPATSTGDPQLLHIKPIKIEVPSIDVHEAARKLVAKREDETRKKHLRKQLDEAEHLIQSEIEKEWEAKSGDVQTRAEEFKTVQKVLRKPVVFRPPAEAKPQQPEVVMPSPPDFSDEDLLYLHGAALAEETTDTARIVPIDAIQGIDASGPMFSFDVHGLRLYVSKLQKEELSVTRSGMLLLNKEGSLHYREEHEVIINRLRNEEMIVPFEFGTVVRGKEDLQRKAASLASALRPGISSEGKSSTWLVRLRAHDARVTKVISGVAPATKVQERGREEKRPSKRSDVKTLEKLLQHERTVAESIHALLTGVSLSSEVSLLVNIGNGTSEDWKTILEASYEIPIINRSKFFSDIVELQNEYRKAGLMFEVHGPSGRFSMSSESAVTQAVSA